MRRVFLLTFVAVASVPAASADAVCTSAHTITRTTTLPVVIAKSGPWCLGANINWAQATGAAITIEASDVVLDLNGFRLRNTKAGTSTQAVGIAVADQRNVVIRNGAIQAFMRGISLTDTSAGAQDFGHHVIEDLALDGCTVDAIAFEGTDVSVLRNRVSHVGGSTASSNADATGIRYAAGPRALIADNVVGPVVGVGSGKGSAILVAGSGAVVRHNDVGNHHPVVPATFGIAVVSGAETLLLENSIASFATGASTPAGSTVGLRDNVAVDCTVSYDIGAGGVDLGNDD